MKPIGLLNISFPLKLEEYDKFLIIKRQGFPNKTYFVYIEKKLGSAKGFLRYEKKQVWYKEVPKNNDIEMEDYKMFTDYCKENSLKSICGDKEFLEKFIGHLEDYEGFEKMAVEQSTISFYFEDYMITNSNKSQMSYKQIKKGWYFR